MPINKRKLGPKPKQETVEAKERELDTTREINKVLDQKQVRQASRISTTTTTFQASFFLR